MKNKKKTNLRTLTAILLSAACAFSSLPAGVVLAEEATNTQSVKEILPTKENALTDEMKTGMGSIIYYVGTIGIWNEAYSSTVYTKNDPTGIYQLADEGLGKDYSISDKFYRTYKDDTGTYAGELRPRGNYTGWSKDEDGNITNGPNWGYQGFRLKYTWNFSDQATIDAVPDKYWGNVMDISAYENTGYAVFEIGSASGDLENAYLTFGSLRDIWQAGTNGAYGSDNGAITKATHPNITSQEHFKTRMAGVKLTDYYDAEKGGAQNVAVPLSAFKTADFNDVRFMVYTADAEPTSENFLTQTEIRPLRLDWLHTWGITRLNSDTDDKEFKIQLDSIKIVDVEAPENLKSTVTADGISLSWEPSASTDVTSYQILRNDTVIATVSDTKYVDETAARGVTYTYKVRAKSPDYDIYSPAATIEGELPDSAVVKLFVGEGDSRYETVYAHDGTMYADFYAPEDAIGIIANYDENGNLQGAASTVATAGVWTTATLNNCSKTDTIKAFLWDTDQAPLTSPVETTVKNLKILALGNSFSHNATLNLHQMAAADGVDLDVTNMYIGGCSLQVHWNNIQGDIGAYEVWTNGSRINSYGSTGKISEILESEEWDIITLQQASWLSVDYNSYEPYVTNITNYLQKAEPGADIIFHQTWEYGEEYGKDTLGDSYVGTEMCASILANAQKSSSIISGITGSEKKIIPSGMAVREVLNTDPDYVVWSDGCHMNNDGCYLVSLVWYATLAGGDIANSKYTHSSCTDEETAMFKECAQKAVDNYFCVTD